MTSPTAYQTSAYLEATFGLGRDWTSQAGQSATVWETPAYHLLWFNDAASDVELRRLWEARKGRQAYPVVLLAPSEDVNKLRVVGPQDARPIRELPVSRVLDLLETSHSLAAREAASFLAREFSRLEEAVVPGLRVKDLLTPHFMRERLRRPINEQRLAGAVEGIASTSSIAWRSLFQGMGYQVEQLPQRGYLLRHDNAPVAVVLPRSLAGKPLAGFRATPSRRNPVLYGMVVYAMRFKNPLLHRQSTLRKRRLGENRVSGQTSRNAFLAEGAKRFRQWLFTRNSLRRLDLLLNNRSWAFTIHPQYTIALLTGQRHTPTGQAAFQVTGPSASLDEFQASAQGDGITIPTSSLGSAYVVPLMPSQVHADVLAKLRRGIQFDALQNPESQEISRGRAAASHASSLYGISIRRSSAPSSHIPKAFPYGRVVRSISTHHMAVSQPDTPSGMRSFPSHSRSGCDLPSLSGCFPKRS